MITQSSKAINYKEFTETLQIAVEINIFLDLIRYRADNHLKFSKDFMGKFQPASQWSINVILPIRLAFLSIILCNIQDENETIEEREREMRRYPLISENRLLSAYEESVWISKLENCLVILDGLRLFSFEIYKEKFTHRNIHRNFTQYYTRTSSY